MLDADGLLRELHTNSLVGHSRAIAIDRALGSFDEATLVRLAPTLFGDGSVSSLVAERYAAHPEMALELARNFLGQGAGRFTMKGWSVPARVARYTAVQVLRRIASAQARDAFKAIRGAVSKDPALQNFILRAEQPDSQQTVPEHLLDKLNAGNWESRADALGSIVSQGLLAALPHVRRIAATDPSVQVRYRAWYAQAALLDVDAVPLWIAALTNRAANDDAGREALHALAHIGDNRSIAPLLDAFEEGYKPALVAEALRAFGPAIVPPLIARLEARPDLVERKVTVDVGAAVELAAVNEMLAHRLTFLKPESFAANAVVYLKFFNKNPTAQKAVATLVQARLDSSHVNLPGDLNRSLSRALSKSK
jgi:HEAT repeat protein